MRCFILLCSQLGLRFSEAASIAPANYNPEAHTITFFKKGREQHTLPTTPELEFLFQQARPTDDHFTTYMRLLRGTPDARGDRLSKKTIRQAWYRLKRKAQVNPDLRPHDLRRTLAVSLYELTKDILAVSKLLGHSQTSSTLEYLQHRDPEKLRALLAQLRMPTEKKQ